MRYHPSTPLQGSVTRLDVTHDTAMPPIKPLQFTSDFMLQARLYLLPCTRSDEFLLDVLSIGRWSIEVKSAPPSLSPLSENSRATGSTHTEACSRRGNATPTQKQPLSSQLATPAKSSNNWPRRAKSKATSQIGRAHV